MWLCSTRTKYSTGTSALAGFSTPSRPPEFSYKCQSVSLLPRVIRVDLSFFSLNFSLLFFFSALEILYPELVCVDYMFCCLYPASKYVCLSKRAGLLGKNCYSLFRLSHVCWETTLSKTSSKGEPKAIEDLLQDDSRSRLSKYWMPTRMLAGTRRLVRHRHESTC